jgi:hypothetical protein
VASTAKLSTPDGRPAAGQIRENQPKQKTVDESQTILFLLCLLWSRAAPGRKASQANRSRLLCRLAQAVWPISRLGLWQAVAWRCSKVVMRAKIEKQ